MFEVCLLDLESELESLGFCEGHHLKARVDLSMLGGVIMQGKISLSEE